MKYVLLYSPPHPLRMYKYDIKGGRTYLIQEYSMRKFDQSLFSVQIQLLFAEYRIQGRMKTSTFEPIFFM